MISIKNLFGGNKTDLQQLYQDGAMVLDVRTADEYKAGHFKDSTNIPLDSITTKLQSIKASGKSVITVCRSGARSSMAVTILEKAGIKAYNGGPWTVFQAKITGK